MTTKSELIQKVSEKNPHLTIKDVEIVVESFFNEISNQLQNGGRVELRNFGAFDIKHREPRKGRNPRNGEAVDIPAKKVPFFKAGKLLKERLNK